MSTGERLDKFAKERYGNSFGYKSLFAKDLGIAKNTLSRYINNSLTPGNSLHKKLRELGCDIEWLMTGARKEVVGGQEITITDRAVVEGTAERDVIIGKLEEEKAKLEEINRDLEEKKAILAARNEQLMQENQDLYKKLVKMLEEKTTTLGNESPSPSSSSPSVLKKISIEA